MNDSPTSLDRLHDLALPPEVPWWPPAPGWYVVALAILVLASFLAYSAWRRYRADAYRRAALHELSDAKDVATIAEILRRTALAIVPRQEIAQKTGTEWIEWLSLHSTGTMSDEVRGQLAGGVYRTKTEDRGIESLRRYATRWIKNHHQIDGHQPSGQKNSPHET